MNDLEKEIDLESNKYWTADGVDETVTFKQGCEFILEKNLDEQFAEWLGDYFLKNSPGMWQNFVYLNLDFEVDELYEISYLKQYWLENIYGKY
jgi:hypothetical protein